jgi:TonB family protein
MKLLSFLISIAIHVIFIAAYLFFIQTHTLYKEPKKIYTVDIIQLKTQKNKPQIKKKKVAKVQKKKIKPKPVIKPKPKPKKKVLKPKPKPKPKLKPKPKPKKKNINKIFNYMIKNKIEQLKKKIKQEEIEKLREQMIQQKIAALKKEIANRVEEGKKKEEIAYSYIQLIKNIIYSNWGVEKSLLNNNRYTTDVDIRLDFRGDLIYIKIVRSSGNAYFDGTIMEAIKNSAPFPKPPTQILENGFVEFIITFDSEEKK